MTSRAAMAAAAVIVTASSVSAQQAGRRPSAAWRDIQGFNIVLVVGETQRGTSAIEDVPSGARKALNDMSEFLPYKYYRVLDSQWTSCCSPDLVRLGTPIAGRLQGVAGNPGSGGATVLVSRGYAFNLSISETVDGNRIPVRFALRLDEPASGRSAQTTSNDRTRESRTADLRAELESLDMQIKNLQARVEIGTANPLELRPLQDRSAQLQRQLADTMAARMSQSATGRSTTIIDSSFTMDVGETVVVGTSRLGGDKALIALVTAVRRSAPAR